MQSVPKSSLKLWAVVSLWEVSLLLAFLTVLFNVTCDTHTNAKMPITITTANYCNLPPQIKGSIKKEQVLLANNLLCCLIFNKQLQSGLS